MPSGYFCRNQKSSLCLQAGNFFTLESINSCLKRKTLSLMGDSAMHQWIGLVAFPPWRSLTPRATTPSWKFHSQLRIARKTAKLIESPNISPGLDTIKAEGEAPVVVIGVGQHFRALPPEAIQRLQVRSPGTQIFIKLENSMELVPEKLAQMEVFGDLEVGFVDAWEITVAASSIPIHPSLPVRCFCSISVVPWYICFMLLENNLK
uniref:NXPE C-terminal domain-containing protein n=1 Tax=Paramormyrops kingsleyae TaxID=1676925 RepID=A0A3B3QP93_9TELE